MAEKRDKCSKNPQFLLKAPNFRVGKKSDQNRANLKIWRESDKRAILYFQKKKECKKWNPLKLESNLTSSG